MKKHPNKKERTKSPSTIQFYDDVKQAGKKRAEALGISFQQYLEDLILADTK